MTNTEIFEHKKIENANTRVIGSLNLDPLGRLVDKQGFVVRPQTQLTADNYRPRSRRRPAIGSRRVDVLLAKNTLHPQAQVVAVAAREPRGIELTALRTRRNLTAFAVASIWVLGLAAAVADTYGPDLLVACFVGAVIYVGVAFSAVWSVHAIGGLGRRTTVLSRSEIDALRRNYPAIDVVATLEAVAPSNVPTPTIDNDPHFWSRSA